MHTLLLGLRRAVSAQSESSTEQRSRTRTEGMPCSTRRLCRRNLLVEYTIIVPVQILAGLSSCTCAQLVHRRQNRLSTPSQSSSRFTPALKDNASVFVAIYVDSYRRAQRFVGSSNCLQQHCPTWIAAQELVTCRPSVLAAQPRTKAHHVGSNCAASWRRPGRAEGVQRQETKVWPGCCCSAIDKIETTEQVSTGSPLM